MNKPKTVMYNDKPDIQLVAQLIRTEVTRARKENATWFRITACGVPYSDETFICVEGWEEEQNPHELGPLHLDIAMNGGD